MLAGVREKVDSLKGQGRPIDEIIAKRTPSSTAASKPR